MIYEYRVKHFIVENIPYLASSNPICRVNYSPIDFLNNSNTWLKTNSLSVKLDKLLDKSLSRQYIKENISLDEAVSWVAERNNERIKVPGRDIELNNFIVEPYIAKQRNEYYLKMNRNEERQTSTVKIVFGEKPSGTMHEITVSEYTNQDLSETLLVDVTDSNNDTKRHLRKFIRDLFEQFTVNFIQLEINRLFIMNDSVCIFDLSGQIDAEKPNLHETWGDIEFPAPNKDQMYITRLNRNYWLKLTVLSEESLLNWKVFYLADRLVKDYTSKYDSADYFTKLNANQIYQKMNCPSDVVQESDFLKLLKEHALNMVTQRKQNVEKKVKKKSVEQAPIKIASVKEVILNVNQIEPAMAKKRKSAESDVKTTESASTAATATPAKPAKSDKKLKESKKSLIEKTPSTPPVQNKAILSMMLNDKSLSEDVPVHLKAASKRLSLDTTTINKENVTVVVATPSEVVEQAKDKIKIVKTDKVAEKSPVVGKVKSKTNETDVVKPVAGAITIKDVSSAKKHTSPSTDETKKNKSQHFQSARKKTTSQVIIATTTPTTTTDRNKEEKPISNKQRPEVKLKQTARKKTMFIPSPTEEEQIQEASKSKKRKFSNNIVEPECTLKQQQQESNKKQHMDDDDSGGGNDSDETSLEFKVQYTSPRRYDMNDDDDDIEIID